MAQRIESPLAGGSIQFQVDDASSGRPWRGVGDGPVAMASETFQVAIVKAGSEATLESTLS